MEKIIDGRDRFMLLEAYTKANIKLALDG